VQIQLVHYKSGHWLKHLIDANRRSAYVGQSAFERVCAYKWLELSHHFNRLGKICWTQFMEGPVGPLMNMPGLWASIASLRIKTLR
jgi:hypothetical protein